MRKDVFKDRLGRSTRCVWGDESGVSPEGVTVVPVFHDVTFAYDDLDEWAAVGRGEKPGHVYSRNTNPTVDDFESRTRRETS